MARRLRWYSWTFDHYRPTTLIHEPVGVRWDRGSYISICFVQHEESGVRSTSCVGAMLAGCYDGPVEFHVRNSTRE